METEFRNWSGSLVFTPGSSEMPKDEAQLSHIVRNAFETGKNVRVAAAGHSSMPLVQTDDILIYMDNFKGLVSHDTNAGQINIKTGMTLKEAGDLFLEKHLALHNLGDVNVQRVVGAIGTGTHGTGERLPIISDSLVKVRMITSSGEIEEFDISHDPDILQACRVSLGVLGIFTEITLQLIPAYQLVRREWCANIDDCIANIDELIESNRNFDFYWYPRRDDVRLRTMNLPGEGMADIPYAKMVEENTGWSSDIIAKTRTLKFDEMEYAIPRASALECFLKVRDRTIEKHRKYIGWRILVRTIAADDAYLSSSYKKDVISISLHHNAGLPFWDYFKDIETIFRSYNGIPHWGKKHSLKAENLKPLFPEWDKFMEIRRMLDPACVFMNPFLRELFEIEQDKSEKIT